MKLFLLYKFILLAAFISLARALFGQDAPTLFEIRTDLQAPLSIELKNGNFQTGQVVNWDGQNMRLRVDLGGGTAEMSFSVEEIRAISFSGNKHFNTLYEWMRTPGRAEDALELFRAYYQQRGAYLDLLGESDINLFFRYAMFALEQNKPLRAVAMIEVFRPLISDPIRLRELDNAILLGFFMSGMHEEAEAQARLMIEESPPTGRSVMPWRVLAELHFEAERYEASFWTAIQPIAHSNQMPMAELDACYALAIVAAEELQLKEYEQRLAMDMLDRELSWPSSIPALVGREPKVFSLSFEQRVVTEEENILSGEETLFKSLETPAPIDPRRSLPSRLNL